MWGVGGMIQRRGNRSARRRQLSCSALPTVNPTWTDLGSCSRLRRAVAFRRPCISRISNVNVVCRCISLRSSRFSLVTLSETRPRRLLAHRSQLTQLQTNKTSLNKGRRTEGPTNTNRSSVTTFEVLAALFLRIQVVRDASSLHWVSFGRRFEEWLLSSVRAQYP
jgi:hypothetical protein